MDANTIINIIGFAALLGGGTLYVFSRLPKQTIANYKDYVASQDKRLGELEKSDKEKASAIAALTSKIEVLQTIPLADIANAIKETAVAIKDINSTQSHIIELINSKNETV